MVLNLSRKHFIDNEFKSAISERIIAVFALANKQLGRQSVDAARIKRLPSNFYIFYLDPGH